MNFLKKGLAQVSAAVEKAREATTTVSYTHLTLPTKRIV